MVPVTRTASAPNGALELSGPACAGQARWYRGRNDASRPCGDEGRFWLSAGEGFRVTASLWDLYDRWWEEVADESRRLDQLFASYHVRRVVDAAAGRGRLALALAQCGYQVSACEADEELFQQARRSLGEASVAVPLYRVGLPGLAEVVSGPFDAVLALHDALARWPPPDQVRALVACARLLAPDGLLVLGMRDWEAVLRDRDYFVPRRVARLNGSRLLMFDVRAFRPGRVVWTTFYLLEHKGKWRVRTTSVTYYPVTSLLLEQGAALAGLAVVERVDHPSEQWWIMRLQAPKA